MTTHSRTVDIEADQSVPLVRITRDFTATVPQVMRAHTDPQLFARWAGPDSVTTEIDYWDARTGGSWRYTQRRADDEFAFYGSFHEVGADRIVQTFTFEGFAESVALETLWFEDLGGGRTRLRTQSLVDSFEARDAFLRSGMETGVDEGYRKLDTLLAVPLG